MPESREHIDGTSCGDCHEQGDVLLDGTVTLVTDSQEQLASPRQQLAEASEYFSAMFSSNMLESRADTIKIHGVDFSHLQALVKFSTISDTLHEQDFDTLLMLLRAAAMLQFTSAIHRLEYVLFDLVGPSNCFSAMAEADNCGLNKLYNKAKAVSLWHFSEVIQTEEMLAMPYPAFRDYLSCPMINVQDELIVYSALAAWIAHAQEDRLEHFEQLFECVHVEAMSEENLEQLMREKLVGHPQCLSRVKELHESVSQLSSEEASERQERLLLHPPRKVPEALVVVGGEKIFHEVDVPTETNRHVLLFDEETKTLEPMTELPFAKDVTIWGYMACALGKDLYLSGGLRKAGRMHKEHYNLVWKFDSLDGRWKFVTGLPNPRRHHGMFAKGRYLYMVGGFGRHRILQNTVDRYDTIKDEWSSLPNMHFATYSVALCSGDDERSIYVIKTNVERYDESKNHWEVLHMHIPFEVGLHCALKCGGHIYLLAIHCSKLYKLNLERKCTVEVGSFPAARGGHACVYNNKIYVVSGEDVDHIDSYDVETGTFQNVCKLEYSLQNHTVATVPLFPVFKPSQQHD